MTFNPLWRFTENFDGGDLIFRQSATARGSYGNTHTVWISPDAYSLITSTDPPVYLNSWNLESPVVHAAIDGYFGGGSPLAPGGGTISDFIMNNVQWRLTDVSPQFYNVISAGLFGWVDLTSTGLSEMQYAGGGYATYTIELRDKNTGMILASPVFSLDAP